MQRFEKVELSDKVKVISERIDNIQKTNTNLQVTDIRDTYTPEVVDVEIGTGKKCVLYNRKTQGGYGLCWAASNATISNYLNGSDYTATQIADAEGIDYNAGANGAQAQKAMKDFQVPYEVSGATLSWNTIKSKIVSKTPIYMRSTSNIGGHATVLYGYKNKNGIQYIVMWNPGTNQVGSTEIVEFNGSNTTYSYANTTFTWYASIYR